MARFVYLALTSVRMLRKKALFITLKGHHLVPMCGDKGLIGLLTNFSTPPEEFMRTPFLAYFSLTDYLTGDSLPTL